MNNPFRRCDIKYTKIREELRYPVRQRHAYRVELGTNIISPQRANETVMM